MALVGCLKYDYSLSQYFLQIDSLNCQFKSSFLELNKLKLKSWSLERVREEIHRRRSIDNQGVDIVSSFKYLGSLIDTNLTFCDHIDYVGPIQESPTALVSSEKVAKL